MNSDFRNNEIEDDDLEFANSESFKSSAMSRRSVDNELRDNLYRLKLQLISEKLRNDSSGIMVNTPPVPVYSELPKNSHESQLEQKLAETKKQFKKIKNKLKEQELEKRLSATSSSTSHNDRQPSDRFGQYIEMMMLQQTQTQNMILNHMMINNTPKPTYIPQPVQYPIAQPMPVPQYQPVPLTPYQPLYKPEIPLANISPIPNATIKPLERPIKPIPVDKTIMMPFPGNEAQQSLRRLGLAALFCTVLKSNYEDETLALSSNFLFELKIKEIITSLHNIYLNQEGSIYPLFQPILNSSSIDFRILLTKSATKEELNFVDREMNYFIQNLISQITEIMPIAGPLGTESRSILSEFVQTNQTFPRQYFFNCEMSILQVDSDDCLHNVGVVEAQILLIGIFFIRSLVMTVMLKPVEYGVTPSLSTVGRENLIIISSVIVYIYRSLLSDYLVQRFPNESNKKQFLSSEIQELKSAIISDAELEPALKSLKKTVDYGKNVISKWAFTYVSKLRPI